MGQAEAGALAEHLELGTGRSGPRRAERTQVAGDRVGDLSGQGALEQARREGGGTREMTAYGVVDGRATTGSAIDTFLEPIGGNGP